MKCKNDCYEEPPFNAVRGRNVYQLTSRRQLVTGLGSSFLSVIEQRFLNPASAYRVRAHNAVLDVVAGGGYELLIPGDPKAKKAVRVRLDFETKPTLTHGIHGTEQGPAQYKLIRDSSGWKAKIEVNETLHRRDLPFIIGHELDEIALIVRQEPTDDAARKRVERLFWQRAKQACSKRAVRIRKLPPMIGQRLRHASVST